MTIQSKTILFGTGCFVSYKCWDNWTTFFESKGYTALAPAWPLKEASPVQSMTVENVVIPFTNTFDASGNLTSLSRVGPYDGLGTPTVTEQYRYRQ